jgi:hypothetical protein
MMSAKEAEDKRNVLIGYCIANLMGIMISVVIQSLKIFLLGDDITVYHV